MFEDWNRFWTEAEVFNILKERVYQVKDDRLKEYEKLVIKSSKFIRQLDGKLNDDVIVASAMHYAQLTGRHVALITGDMRFDKISTETQRYLDSNPETEGLRDFLNAGNFSIIHLLD